MGVLLEDGRMDTCLGLKCCYRNNCGCYESGGITLGYGTSPRNATRLSMRENSNSCEDFFHIGRGIPEDMLWKEHVLLSGS
jgi:hypothetical protein